MYTFIFCNNFNAVVIAISAAIMMASITGDCSLYHKEQNDKLRQEVVEEEEQLEEEDEEMSDLKVFPVNPSSSTISAVLETRDLWKQFDELGTEMIVTRRGRLELIIIIFMLKQFANCLIFVYSSLYLYFINNITNNLKYSKPEALLHKHYVSITSQPDLHLHLIQRTVLSSMASKLSLVYIHITAISTK